MDVVEEIRAACDAAGVILPAGAEPELAVHLDAVLKANQRMNLTAIRNVEDAIYLHVIDSLLCIREINEAPEGRIADLGSGAGYPGIPLALATSRSVDLVESITKKADFLGEVAALLGESVEIRVRNTRAEMLALTDSGGYSVVTARALSGLQSLVELASPLLRPGGRLVALKGRVAEEELEAGTAVAALVGMRLLYSRRYVLPVRGDARACVVYEKIGESRIRLPRREGLAQRKPLG